MLLYLYLCIWWINGEVMNWGYKENKPSFWWGVLKLPRIPFHDLGSSVVQISWLRSEFPKPTFPFPCLNAFDCLILKSSKASVILLTGWNIGPHSPCKNGTAKLLFKWKFPMDFVYCTSLRCELCNLDSDPWSRHWKENHIVCLKSFHFFWPGANKRRHFRDTKHWVWCSFILSSFP